MQREGVTGGKTAIGIALLLAAAVVFAVDWHGAGQSGAEDLVITDISVRRVATGGDDPAQGLVGVGAIVGDQLHVRAVVANNGTTVTYERLRVDFYFTENVTKEHGLLGTQTVFKLAPGEERLPAISVPTDGFTPGFYSFTAAIADPADPEGGYVVEYPLPTDEITTIAISGEGPRIAELRETVFPFALCQFGGLQSSIQIKLGNVGTAEFEGFTVRTPTTSDLLLTACTESGASLCAAEDYSASPEQCGERSGITIVEKPFETYAYEFGGIGDISIQAKLDTSAPITLPLTLARMSQLSPGARGTLFLEYCTSPLSGLYRAEPTSVAHFEVLGQAAKLSEPLQLEVSITPRTETSAGTTRTLLLPSDDESAIVYSELDLWQFPQPALCGCASVGTCEQVPTASPGLKPVYEGSGILFHVTDTGSGEQLIHALDPNPAEDEPLVLASSATSLGARAVTDPVFRPGNTYRETVFVEEKGADGLLETSWYHVYVGAADGSVHKHSLKKTSIDQDRNTLEYEWILDGGDSEVEAWTLQSGLVADTTADRPTTHLLLAEAPTGEDDEVVDVLVVSGPSGLFTLDARTGAKLQTITEEAVLLAPAIAAGAVWYVIGDKLNGAKLDASGDEDAGCTAVELTLDGVPNTALQAARGALFWGDARGGVYAIVVGANCSRAVSEVEADIDATIASIGPVAGAAAVEGDGTHDVVVFATDIDGKIIAIEFNTSTAKFSDSIATYSGWALNGEGDLTDAELGRIGGEGNGSELTPLRGRTTASPVVVVGDADPETVFLVGEFDAVSDTDAKEGEVAALVAFDPNLHGGNSQFIVRKATSWGAPVQFVLKLADPASDPGDLEPVLMLEPVLAGNTLVVTVPGQRLYALDISELLN